MVYPDSYRCLSCGAFGKTEKLLQKVSNFTLVPKTKIDFRNPWSRWTKNLSLYEVIKQSWKTLKSSPGLGIYLKNRGFTPQILNKLGIGYREDWYTIPILDENKVVVGAVARANAETNHSPSKYIIPNGQSTDLVYVPSWKEIKLSSYIYLTFGILDAITLHILGKPAMSTTGGKRINPDALDGFRKEIRIIPDLGEEIDAHMIAKCLGWRGKVIELDYQDNTKDTNDLYCKGYISILEAL